MIGKSSCKKLWMAKSIAYFIEEIVKDTLIKFSQKHLWKLPYGYCMISWMSIQHFLRELSNNVCNIIGKIDGVFSKKFLEESLKEF